MKSTRKSLMSVAMHDDDFLHQEFATTYAHQDTRERSIKVTLSKPNRDKPSAGWAELVISHHGDKRTTQHSICLNIRQATALRDLLNGAFGSSSRVARTLAGSMYGPHPLRLVEDEQ